MALTREVDLHRQAAARQLETLEKIEEGRLEEANGENDQQRLVRIDESHIPVSNTTQLNEDRNF